MMLKIFGVRIGKEEESVPQAPVNPPNSSSEEKTVNNAAPPEPVGEPGDHLGLSPDGSELIMLDANNRPVSEREAAKYAAVHTAASTPSNPTFGDRFKKVSLDPDLQKAINAHTESIGEEGGRTTLILCFQKEHPLLVEVELQAALLDGDTVVHVVGYEEEPVQIPVTIDAHGMLAITFATPLWKKATRLRLRALLDDQGHAELFIPVCKEKKAELPPEMPTPEDGEVL